jgi:PAS domain S-box-containing protein
MRRTSHWWTRQIAAMPEFGTARMAGSVSGALYLLCGLLVLALGLLVPAAGPHVNQRLVVAVGITAMLSGVVIATLPWRRWHRSSTLPLIPLSFALIAVHNYANGADGLRYNLFFFVVFVWIGLMHPIGTSLKSAPLMAIGYLAPSYWLHDLSTLAGSMAYALPVCVIVGECVSLVAARLHHSEEEVRASGQRFRALVHHSTDVVSVIDAEGVIRWESPSITKVLGYEPDERTGRVATDFVHPDHLALAGETLAVLAAVPGSAAIAEVQVLHKDGTWRWCEARGHNVLEDPAVGGIVVNFTDVTERHADEAVRRQLAAIVESSNDAITAETKHGIVLSWNSAAERMYGYRADEMLGDSIMTIVPADRADELGEMYRRVAAGGIVAAAETQRVCRDGSLLDVSLSLSPVYDAAGTVVAVASIARDISDEIRARRALADR